MHLIRSLASSNSRPKYTSIAQCLQASHRFPIPHVQGGEREENSGGTRRGQADHIQQWQPQTKEEEEGAASPLPSPDPPQAAIFDEVSA